MIGRLLLLGFVVLPFMLVALPVQMVILLARLPGWQLLPLAFFRLVAFSIGLRVSIKGEPVRDRPVLLVSNHIGWLDIIAIGSQLPVSFVAKAEVADWPVVGVLARMQRTIFVDRQRRAMTKTTAEQMRRRIGEGTALVLFAEGTSGTGTHVLAFRTSLLEAAQPLAAEAPGSPVLVQPLAIAYTRIAGLPLSRADRLKVAWIGDMGIGDNLVDILGSGPKDVTIAFGSALAGGGDRKEVARLAYAQVRQMLNALNRCQPLPKPQELGKPRP